MLLVILEHAIGTPTDSISKYILSFHMPAFFFISGIAVMYSKRSNSLLEDIFHKIRTLGYQYLVIGIEKYSSVHYGASTDGAVDRNHSAGRGGAIPSLGEIRNCHINVGTGKELTIRELSEQVVKAVGFEGEVEFDASKPDGTMRKLIDVSKLHTLGWTHKVEIEDGVTKLFHWYKESLE